MKFHTALFALVTIAALSHAPAANAEPTIAVEDLKNGVCHSIEFDSQNFIICPVEIGVQDLRMFHEDGEPSLWGPSVFGFFDQIDQHLAGQGKQLSFAMNGGMYHRDKSAVGLYIANGSQNQNLNTNEGTGNFHLLPNGVFFWDKNQAGVMEANAYRDADIMPSYATQSGPMLVIDGKLHHRFRVNGTSLKMRNGVGVKQDGKQTYFAISEQPVNFESFGRLFRDYLKTPNALFLDGGRASQIFAANLDRNDNSEKLGPIIAVVEPVDGSNTPANLADGKLPDVDP